MAKKYIDNGKKDKKNGGDLLGIALIIVSAFFLLCIIVPIMLGAISQAVRGVVLGIFGIFAYPMFLALLVLGIAIVRGYGIDMGLKNRICIGITVFCLFMILQLATSFMYIGEGFSHYISSVFDAKYTGGGVLFGVFAYGLQAAVGQVFTYILMSICIVVCVLAMFNVFAMIGLGRKGKAVKGEPEQQTKAMTFEKSDRQAKAVKPIVDNGLFVGTIVNNRTPVSATGGTAMDMPDMSQRQDTRPSKDYYDYDNGYDGYRPAETYSPAKQSGGLFGSSGGVQFEKYHNDEKRPSARDILYGSGNVGYNSGSSMFTGYASSPSSPASTSIGSGMPYPLAFPDDTAPIAPITPTPAVSAPEVKSEQKRPPKFLHSVVFPEPKDISDKIVDGEIFDGEEISRKKMEEDAAKNAKSEVSDYVKFDFDGKKVQPTTFSPLGKVSATEKSAVPEAEKPEIINGDFYSGVKNDESALANGVPPFVDETPRDSVKAAARNAAPVRSTGLTLEIPEVVSDEPIKAEEPIAPIIDGDTFKRHDGFDSLMANERKIRDSKYSDGFSSSASADYGKRIEPDNTIEKDTTERKSGFAAETDDTPVSPIASLSSISFDDVSDDGDFENTSYSQSTVELPPIITGDNTLSFSDEVEDLSEKKNLIGRDNTGYYDKGDSPELISADIRKNDSVDTVDIGVPEPIIFSKPEKPRTQISIDDAMKVKPEDLPKPKPKKKHTRYVPPPIDLLVCKSTDPSVFSGNAEENAKILEATLESLKFPAKVTGITSGPAVTRYELEVPPGNSVRRIDAFADDIAYNLASSSSIRIETPIPGKRAVGIEVPNAEIATVALHDIIDCKEFQNATSPLTFAIGKDIAGANIICNLEKMPHLLIAGATGSGKSACLNSIIISLLYKTSPDDVRLILIDPKEVEFRVYQDMPHLLIKSIINDTEQAIRAFKWAKTEMDRRYKLLSKYCVRNIQEFNNSNYVKDGIEDKLPRIVIVVDELCELMLSVNRKDLEEKIMSMAQKARAAGLHLILATQRPSVDVITGTIKANLPSRIAFAVSSFNDSRTILDQGGAESLLGRGDMLYAPADMPQPKRVQGAFITTDEVTSVVEYVKSHNQVDYDDSVEELIMTAEVPPSESGASDGDDDDEFDPLIKDVCRRVIETGQASTSMIQRRFSVGYARASRIIDQMETRKFIGPLEGSNKPREVYITAEQFRETFGEDV